jgi:putative transposase
MKFSSDKHHRRSIRLRNYDYAREEAYFITICSRNRECLFGDIVDSEMELNEPGKMIENALKQLGQRFANVRIDAYEVMPNHVHAILWLVGDLVAAFKSITTDEYIRGVKSLG